MKFPLFRDYCKKWEVGCSANQSRF